MAAPKGNRFWEVRSSHGRKPIFATPEDIWNASCEYFKWCEDNPLYEAKLTTFQGVSEIEHVPKMRAMTVAGLCIFLDITQETFFAYRKKEGFSEILHKIEDIIRTQKFAGAAAELLNANIIARDLGLKEQTEQIATVNIKPKEWIGDADPQEI